MNSASSQGSADVLAKIKNFAVAAAQHVAAGYVSKLSWADQECPVGKWGKSTPTPPR